MEREGIIEQKCDCEKQSNVKKKIRILNLTAVLWVS